MDTHPGENPQSLTEQVATEIRVELARQGIRQSELARKLGRNDQWLSVRVRGVHPIDLNDLEEIAAGLGVPVTKLLPDSVEQVLNQEVIRSRPLRSRPARHARSAAKHTHEYERPAVRPRDGRPKGRPAERGPTPTRRRPVRIDSPSVKPSGSQYPSARQPASVARPTASIGHPIPENL